MLKQETRTAIEQLLQSELTYCTTTYSSKHVVFHNYTLDIPLMDEFKLSIYIMTRLNEVSVGMSLFVENYYECNGRDIDFSHDLYRHHMENTYQQEHLVIESVKQGLAASRQKLLSMLLRIPSSTTQQLDTNLQEL